MLADTALVQVVRYNRLRDHCPGNPAAPYELTTPLPDDRLRERQATSPTWPTRCAT